MILRRLARPQAISQTIAQVSHQHLPTLHQCRYIHRVPALGDASNSLGELFAEHGVPNFVTPRTFDQTWTKYQNHLVEQMNEQTADTEHENESAYQIHVQMSRNPLKAPLYNTAAMAHFNHLFWEGLSLQKTECPPALRQEIEDQFGSLNELRIEMLNHADAMFGNGFVWLLKEKSIAPQLGMGTGKLRILCTYNAGSPYAAAYRMRQHLDRSTNMDVTQYRDWLTSLNQHQPDSSMTTPQNTVSHSGQYSLTGRDGHTSSTTLDAAVLLCVNVWHHMWQLDYGILGKQQYLLNWWERIDWNVVNNRNRNAISDRR